MTVYGLSVYLYIKKMPLAAQFKVGMNNTLMIVSLIIVNYN
jgi:hypothetical protein